MTSLPENRQKVIGSVQKAIDILDLFDRHNYELGTTEIAKALEIPKSTAAGIIHTLDLNGYLDQNQKNRKYRLGIKLVERGSVLLSHLDLRQIALPHLEKLRDWCNEGVNLAIRDGHEVVYIERLFGTNLLGMRSEIGKREPVHSTALGKALLACLPDEEIKKFIARHKFTSITPRTITDDEQFLIDLRQTRERGFAIDDEENESGGRCIAAPIFDFSGHPIAAVSVSVPVQRLPESKIPLFGDKVVRTTGSISHELGYPIPNSES
jgi:DNA-binding IclR family transcriptional regulator